MKSAGKVYKGGIGEIVSSPDSSSTIPKSCTTFGRRNYLSSPRVIQRSKATKDLGNIYVDVLMDVHEILRFALDDKLCQKENTPTFASKRRGIFLLKRQDVPNITT